MFLDNLVLRFDLAHLDHHPQLQQVSRLLNVKRPSYLVILAAALVVVLSLAKFFQNFITFILAVVVPAYKSMKLPQRRAVLMYWVLLVALLLLDSPLSSLINILPFYPYTKMALYCMLWVQDFRYAGALWDQIKSGGPKALSANPYPEAVNPFAPNYFQTTPNMTTNSQASTVTQRSKQYPPSSQQSFYQSYQPTPNPTQPLQSYSQQYAAPAQPQHKTYFSQTSEALKWYDEYLKKNQ